MNNNVQPQRLVQLSLRISSVGFRNTEVGDIHETVRKPETAVHREACGGKGHLDGFINALHYLRWLDRGNPYISAKLEGDLGVNFMRREPQRSTRTAIIPEINKTMPPVANDIPKT